MKSPRTYRQTARQADRRTFFLLVCLLRHTKHEHQNERIFFFTQAITILSLFTYSVYDEKVKKFQVEVAISYKDMGSQSSLCHQFRCFKARILCHLANLKGFITLGFFWSLITTLRPDFQNSKCLTQ